MSNVDTFLRKIETEFPADRLTFQKAVPTFHVTSASEAARLFKIANREHQPLFITGFGNNIDPQGMPFTSMVAIRTDRLNQVHEINVDDFYITVGGGYPLREINKRLREKELYLPHASLPYVGSVGGALAVGLSADYDGHDFPLKKYFIKADLVTPDGESITPGSTCFKSVAGYDIVKIFSGSWGLLGLIVSATFRVMPLVGESDFVSITQKEISRAALEKALNQANSVPDAVYSRKIKEKFDPQHILPLL